jgi:uncharacterized membrane protein YagU involved in acid resistance
MQEYISASIVNNNNPSIIMKPILKAGFISGVLDITAAMFTYIIMAPGKNPINILNYIASGVFGKETAFAAGWTMPVLGLIFHFLIAFTWAILFYLLYPYFNKVVKNKWMAGILYGILVWLIMTRVVVPLSNTPKNPFRLSSAIVGVLTLIIFLGIPISLITDHYYKRLKKGNNR